MTNLIMIWCITLTFIFLCGKGTAQHPDCFEMDINTQGRQQLGGPTKANSWAECAKKCFHNADCTYWTWVHARNSPYALNCALMNGFAIKVYDANTISGSKACQGDCFETDINTQGRKQLGGPTKANSWAECAKKCSHNADCTYWTWVHARNSPYALTCALMSGFAIKVYDANTISGSKACQGGVAINVSAKKCKWYQRCCKNPNAWGC